MLIQKMCSHANTKFMQACEALVLVFDADSEASLLEVQRWAAGGAADAAEVRVVVANKVDRLVEAPTAIGSAGATPPALQRNAWLAGAQAWCSEHHFEYIEARACRSGSCSVAARAGCRPWMGGSPHKRFTTPHSAALLPCLAASITTGCAAGTISGWHVWAQVFPPENHVMSLIPSLPQSRLLAAPANEALGATRSLGVLRVTK